MAEVNEAGGPNVQRSQTLHVYLLCHILIVEACQIFP